MSKRINLPIIDAETNLYSQEYYRLRLAQEKTRVERSNNPLSVLIVDIKCNKHNGNNGEVRSRFISRIHQITRSTDLKAWYQDDKIAVLMPDTPRQGAFNLADKLYQELMNLNNGQFLPEDCFLQVYTYCKDNNSHQSFTLANNQKQANTCNADTTEPSANPDPPVLSKASVLSDSYFFDILSDSLKSGSLVFQKAVKRGIDILGSLVGIVVFLPAMAVIAPLIKATSPGPVLFKQERVGYRGKKFTFLKFRSMHVNTNENIHKEHVLKLINDSGNGSKSWAKVENDTRVTKLGAFLRKTSLDELPQFFNVLKGDMSLVGPRPPIPYEVEKYQLWHLNRVLEAKPGITGLWQVESRGCSTFNCMVRLDLSYIQNWSLWLDCKILFKTVIVVLSRTGAA